MRIPSMTTVAALAILWQGCAVAPASAEPIDEAKACAAETDSVKRLACFDAAVAPLIQAANEKAAASLPTAGIGKWSSQVEVSPIDDSTSVYLSVVSNGSYQGSYATHQPVLTVRCMENTTSIFVAFDGDYMSDIAGRGTVTFRLDKQPARELEWSVSTNNEALGYWSGGSAIPLIKSMLDAKRLVLRAVPVSSSPVTIEFDVEGLGNAVAPVREHCGW